MQTGNTAPVHIVKLKEIARDDDLAIRLQRDAPDRPIGASSWIKFWIHLPVREQARNTAMQGAVKGAKGAADKDFAEVSVVCRVQSHARDCAIGSITGAEIQVH